MTVGFVILDMAPEAIFIVEFNGEICPFEVGIISYIVSNFEVCHILEILFWYSPVSSSWNNSPTFEVVCDLLRCQIELQLNVMRQWLV